LEIRSAALRSADLTRQLLAFARKQAIHPKVLDLNDTVMSSLKILRRLIGEDIELAWKPAHELWPVKMDPIQIDQMLANLSVNARDAISGVGIMTIKTENVVLDANYCETHAGFVPGEYATLVISDNGCGMDADTLDHLFEPFFTTKELGVGTGLGLATVYGIVKQNNGFINVYSEIGKGTTFRIYLPRSEENLTLETEKIESMPLHGSETLLLVEDDVPTLQLGEAILERCGYKVLSARTPTEAIAFAKQYKGGIDLLITDVVMPEMNGKQLVERICAIRSDLKVLYMSGYTADAISCRGILDQGVNFIQKPFSVRGLASNIREVLNQRAS
jgi:two-component system cell cycle sensor histidine kinase/response regulator CckA